MWHVEYLECASYRRQAYIHICMYACIYRRLCCPNAELDFIKVVVVYVVVVVVVVFQLKSLLVEVCDLCPAIALLCKN